MNGFDKIIAAVVPPLVWISSVELRLKNMVSSKRFDDLKEHMIKIEDKLDKYRDEIKNNRQ